MIAVEGWLETWLQNQPEYRMGYQKVVATLNSGSTESGIIINSQVFMKDAESFPWQMYMDDWEYALREAHKSQLKVTKAIVIPRSPESLKGVRHIAIGNEKFKILANRKRGEALSAFGSRRLQLCNESLDLEIKASNAATDAPLTLTDVNEVFKRFSAYANDHRLTPGKGLTPGTFATTKIDADANVKTGSEAVSRYSLPNPKPASNVFTISPAKDTELKRGTAQPANNQPGGGVEVIFVNGLPDGTVTGPITIPDK